MEDEVISPDLVDARNPGWFWASNLVVRGPQKRSVWALALYVCIASYANRERQAWPGGRKLKALLGCSDRMVQKTLRELTDLGWITVVPRFRKDGSQTTNAYVLNDIDRVCQTVTQVDSQAPPPNPRSGGPRTPVRPNEQDLLEQKKEEDYAQNAATAFRARAQVIGINEDGKPFELEAAELEQIRKEAKPTYRIPAPIVEALDKVPLLAKDPTLRVPGWWQAQHRAYEGVDFAAELYKMGAWVVSNPGKRPKKQLKRFLSNWFSRAYERLEEARS